MQNAGFFAMGASMIVSAAGWAQETGAECSAPVASYQVSYSGERQFAVEVVHSEPRGRWDLAHFPLADRPEAQAASVRDLQAFDASGEPVAINYVGEGGWETDGSATRLTYTLLADHEDVDWNINGPGKEEVGDRFDDSYMFAGHAFFLLDWEMPRCSVTVEFDLPVGWQVTAPWPREGERFVLEDSWDLGQNVFAMGADEAVVSEAGGLTLTWLMDSRLAGMRPAVTEYLAVLPDVYTDFWGEAQGEAYNIFFLSDYVSDGGAFYDSFSLRIATPLSEADTISWSHTLGHEVMHLWNHLGRAEGANVPELEWVNEGFTDYLTVKLMSQAGFLSPEMAEQRIANILRRYNISGALQPGVTLEASGRDKGSNWHIIYGGGGLAALLLDAEMSREDPEAFGRALRTLRAEQGAGYTYESFLARFDALSGGRASEVVAFVDSRPGNSAIIARLRDAGLDVSMFSNDEVYVRFADCETGRCAPDFLAAR